MRKNCFVSDYHFAHGNIIKYCHRPFLSELDKQELSKNGAWHDGEWKGKKSSKWRITDEAIDMMGDVLINETNAVVEEDDILWCLGDFSMAPKNPDRLPEYYRICKRYRDRIKCRTVNLIWGNHDDHCIKDLFNETYSAHEIQIGKQEITLHHYAMLVWNRSHRNAIHLYGHSHSEAEKWQNLHMPGRRSIDVGVDNAAKVLGAYRPFTFDEIVSLMKDKPGFSFDHHVNRNAQESDMGD